MKILHFSVDLFRSVRYSRYGILDILCYEEVVFYAEANKQK